MIHHYITQFVRVFDPWVPPRALSLSIDFVGQLQLILPLSLILTADSTSQRAVTSTFRFFTKPGANPQVNVLSVYNRPTRLEAARSAPRQVSSVK
jgi:hypothetical protein